MGLLASRQRHPRPEEVGSPSHLYRYPAKSGSFFGSHFLMGGERFEASSPEAYLFGENQDINFLGAKPVQFPYVQPQSTEPTRTLHCLVNIRRDSIKFIKVRSDDSSCSSREMSDSCISTDSEFGKHSAVDTDSCVAVGTCESLANVIGDRENVEAIPSVSIKGSSPQVSSKRHSKKETSKEPTADKMSEETKKVDVYVKYNIEFTFDSDCPCSITIYFFAVEKVCSTNGLSYESVGGGETSRTYYFEAGANQVFSQPELIFDPSAFSSGKLQYHSDSGVFPVVIHCVSNQSNEEDVHGPAQSHSTLAVVEKSAEGHGFILKPLKQKLYIDGVCYLLQEIYGIENKNANSSEPGSKSWVSQDEFDENGADCVVCMSDLRDTLILPCRHLCLCNACAETLRYKASNCPICRSPFRALLQIKTLRRLKSTTSAPLLSSASVSGGRKDSEHRLDTRRNDSSEEFVYPPIQGTFLTTRYETVPLVEALNGPVDHTQTCVTLPAPPIPLSHSAPVIAATARSPPRAPPRIGGRHKKKHSKPVVPIQEVLTPQSIGSYSSSSSRERAYSSDISCGPYVTGLEIPTVSEGDEEETEFGAGSPQMGRVTKIVINEESNNGSDNEEISVSPGGNAKSVTGILVHSPSSGALDCSTPRSCVSVASASSTKPLLPDSNGASSYTAE